jgi:hypothetical protein
MAFGFSTYVDPGVYQQEVIVPSGLNIPAQPFSVCLIGTGSRNKRVINEPVVKGIVRGEALTLGSLSGGSYPVTLANRAVRRKEVFSLFRTIGSAAPVEMDDQYYSFAPASITGAAIGGPVSIAPNNAIYLELDDKAGIVLVFVDNTPASYVQLNRQITVTQDFAGNNAATGPELASAINNALSSQQGTDLGFGPTYANVASVVGTALVLTSPVSGPASYVRVSSPVTNSATTAIFGSASLESGTVVRVQSAIYNASATWTADYARAVDTSDPLAQTASVTRLVSVGSSPGATNYEGSYVLSTNQVSWSGLTAASIEGAQLASPVELGAGTTFNIIIDGSDLLTVDVAGLTAIQGSTLDSTPGPSPGGDGIVRAILVANINAFLVNRLGPRYASVATLNASNALILTSPTLGRTSMIQVSAAGTSTAVSTLFRGPQTATGTGLAPANGTTYFATYEYPRPTSEYNVPFEHFSNESVIARVGLPSVDVVDYNPLAVAAGLCFLNGAPRVYTIQINDATSAGVPTLPEIRAAIAGAATQEYCTEVVLVGEPGTRSSILPDLVAHLEDMCSPTEKYYRRLFAGAANNTPIGDRTTLQSLIGWATNYLQVAPSSPGRGRMFMIAPPQAAGVSLTQLLDDGNTVRISSHASTYLAAAVAAKKVSFQSAADTLTRQSVIGFNLDDINRPWLPAERRAMASQGVCVVSYDGGTLRILDALTTEAGRGNLLAFKVDSTSYQKDVIVKKVNQALFDNVVGVVPYDLASFVLDIKLIIQGVLASEIGRSIGPYRNIQTGETRSIDVRTDIRVNQDVNDLTQFNFSYWFNLRYPALRLLGEYSVDNPFFSAGS